MKNQLKSRTKIIHKIDQENGFLNRIILFVPETYRHLSREKNKAVSDLKTQVKSMAIIIHKIYQGNGFLDRIILFFPETYRPLPHEQNKAI